MIFQMKIPQTSLNTFTEADPVVLPEMRGYINHTNFDLVLPQTQELPTCRLDEWEFSLEKVYDQTLRSLVTGIHHDNFDLIIPPRFGEDLLD